MTAQQIIDNLTALVPAARVCGFSPVVTAHLHAVLERANHEKRQRDCPHTNRRTLDQTHPAGRDTITRCLDCAKILKSEPATY